MDSRLSESVCKAWTKEPNRFKYESGPAHFGTTHLACEGKAVMRRHRKICKASSDRLGRHATYGNSFLIAYETISRSPEHRGEFKFGFDAIVMPRRSGAPNLSLVSPTSRRPTSGTPASSSQWTN